MQLKSLFTEYDESIEANAYRDPMGLQIIWSAVGQNIFGRNITSISSDMRNFVINLFNHWIVRNLTVGMDRIELSNIHKEHYSDVSLKTGLIIFLENLLIYILTAGNGTVDSGGLLGKMNAQNRLSKVDGALETIEISVDQDDAILVRQISLGVNGRYKTPFMEADLIDKYYNYDLYDTVWQEVSGLFASDDYRQLAADLKSLIKGLFAGQQHQAPPKVKIQDIPNVERIKKNYVRCFGSRGNIGTAAFQNFWRSRLKLNDGAAGMLYDCAKKMIHDDDITVQRVVSDVYDSSLPESSDRRKIEDIIKLEPFLVSISYLFQLICAKEVETNDDLHMALKDQGQKNFLADLKEKARIAEQVIERIDGYSKLRLRHLTKIDFDTLSQCVAGIQIYQSDVMTQRGNNAWFTISGNKIRHNVREYSIKSVELKEWENGYYVDSMISLCKGLEGVAGETA